MTDHLSCHSAKADSRSLKRQVTGAHPDSAFDADEHHEVLHKALAVQHDDKKLPEHHLEKHLEHHMKKAMTMHDDDDDDDHHPVAHPMKHPANKALSLAAKHDIEDHHPAHPAQKAAAKTQAAVVHATHPSLEKVHSKKHKEPEQISEHPAHHTEVHVANVHKALETSTKTPIKEKAKDHLDDTSTTMQAIHSAQSAIKSKTPAKASEPSHVAMKEAEAHLESAKTHVEHTNAAINDAKVKAKKVTEATVKSAEASHEAHKAAVKSAAVKQAAKEGKATKEHVAKAEKEADDKAKVAQDATAKVVKAETEKKKADIKVAAHKAETKTDVEGAKKMAMVAAKTAKPGEASATKKAAEHLKKSVGHLEPKHPHEHVMKVKTDCDFLENAILLGDLKKMPHIDPEYSCVGFGGHIEDGEMKVAAIKCKPMQDGHCPTSYDESLCKIVPLDINHIEFKQLF